MATAKRKATAKAKTSSRSKTTARKATARKTTARRASSASRTTSRAKSASRARTTAKPKRRWSAKVMERSDALDLKDNIFKNNDPKKIAASLKRSAEHSRRRKAGPYQSAMSMLNFYINRAGKTLSAARKKKLEAAKGELRAQFHR